MDNEKSLEELLYQQLFESMDSETYQEITGRDGTVRQTIRTATRQKPVIDISVVEYLERNKIGGPKDWC